MEYYLLAFWFYFMVHVLVVIYKAQRELNREIKRGNSFMNTKKL